MSTNQSHSFFLLTHNFRDIQNRFEIILYGVSKYGKPIKIIIDNFRPLFFVPRKTPIKYTKSAAERKQLPLKSKNNNEVDCLYFSTYYKYLQCAKFLHNKAISTYESDVHPLDRYLMERMVKGGFSLQGDSFLHNGIRTYLNPRIRGTEISIDLSVLSIDIETNGNTDEIYSIACYSKSEIVFIIGEEQSTKNVKFCKNEIEVLKKCIRHIKDQDPDVIIGWNVINFDMLILKKRCEFYNILFEISRDFGTSITPIREGTQQYKANISGRIVLDVMVLLRTNQYIFENYSLNFVASKILGKHKEIELSGQKKIDEINQLFKTNKFALASYNLSDAKLTKEIFDKLNLLANAIERSKLTGLLIDQFGRSISSFDNLYLPLFHRKGYVADNVSDISLPPTGLSGGYVMDSQPGLYENVILLDFKSLYPTIIKSFYIDPLGSFVKTKNSIKGPTGLSFSSDKSILPGIISKLLEARALAKQKGNKPLSYAIKIIMNSFYGVLGSRGCRFFSSDLASAITGTGQFILKKTKSYIEQNTSYSVIYGDTDSLFILLGPNFEQSAQSIAKEIVRDVNTWLMKYFKKEFNVNSSLELEFESHFRHFFMPTIRGGTQGSKKRYCGTIEKNGELTLAFKGLESVRSDWTVLAKEFQNTLYRKVFENKPVEDYILSVVDDVRNGNVDKKLIYRKQLRKLVHEYTTNIPPHVQAAKLLKSPGRYIRYLVTLDGPQPIEHITSKIDYEHYIDSQLKPIADSILEWKNLDFESIVSGQQNLFL